MKESFKQYLESKTQLLEAAKTDKKLTLIYEVRKYCKVPFVRDGDDEKVYISFKPKDLIEVLWECKELSVVKNVSILDGDNERVKPAWKQLKFAQWLENNASQHK